MSFTDKERLDFLQAQRFTKWVGYDLIAGKYDQQTMWPVFRHDDLRAAIDSAISAQLEMTWRLGAQAKKDIP